MKGGAIERLRLPEQLPEPISHYTDAVIADGWIWISGQLASTRTARWSAATT